MRPPCSYSPACSRRRAQQKSRSWAADNGNGTYSNPLFYDEFSDPDMITKRAAALRVLDRGRGRIALETRGGQYVSVGGAGKAGEVTLKSSKPGDSETFQWVDLQRGETLLLSLATHRYLAVPSAGGAVSADHLGPELGRKDGSCFTWRTVPR